MHSLFSRGFCQLAIRAGALLLMWACLIATSYSQELTVAAAADLRPALDEIAVHFQQSSGVPLHAIYGSSGDLFHQIQNGAPFDVFLSANVDYPRKLEAGGAVVSGTYYEYGRGKIVLLVASNSKLDLNQGLKILLGSDVKKIAIADPSHAPYGAAAVAALKAEHLYEQVSSRLVVGENISQAASFVLSGAADVGIVAMSLALSPATRSQVRFAEIPAADYSPIVQACVVLNSSKNQQTAIKFEKFLRTKEAAEILRRFGFAISDGEGSVQ